MMRAVARGIRWWSRLSRRKRISLPESCCLPSREALDDDGIPAKGRAARSRVARDDKQLGSTFAHEARS